MMHCPKCSGSEYVKNGHILNRQRYKCRGCGCSFTKSEKGRYPESVKRRALQMYLEGLGFRAIERLLCVSHVSVMRWIRLFGEEAARVRRKHPPETVADMALDEVWHYVSKKNGSFGYGLLLTDKGECLWTSRSGTEGAKREKGFGAE